MSGALVLPKNILSAVKSRTLTLRRQALVSCGSADQHKSLSVRLSQIKSSGLPTHSFSPQPIRQLQSFAAGLRIAGRLAAELLDYLTPFVKPGVSTGELDRLAYDYTVNVQGCIPACLGYCPPGMTPYPATTCISINHVVCHGIPSDKKILKAGDIVNIDVTSIKNGYHGDTSRMFVIGKPTIAGKRLVDLAFGTMWAGIDAVRPGGCFNDIGRACQAYADANGISVVRDYGGHGIGKGFHEEPHVNHFPVNRPTPKFEPGMVFTVEPMVNAGRYGVTMLNDGWTVVTKDHSLSAQWEHMVLVTETGYDVLTVSKGTLPPPAFVKGWHLPENL